MRLLMPLLAPTHEIPHWTMLMEEAVEGSVQAV